MTLLHLFSALALAQGLPTPGPAAEAPAAEAPAAEAPAAEAPPARATVISVYDGDTFTLDNGEKVRVSFVNTPELKRPKEAYGEEARAVTAGLVEGKVVDLGYGEVIRDGYGRLLAAVSVDGVSLEATLIQQGLAHLFLIPPYPASLDVPALLALQAGARGAGRGIWSLPSYQGALHITSFRANAEGDDTTNLNGEYVRVCNIDQAPVRLAGYSLRDESGQVLALPDLTVPPGHTVKIHTGEGVDVTDPARSLAVFLDRDFPLWNNDFDTVTILAPDGSVVDKKVHGHHEGQAAP